MSTDLNSGFHKEASVKKHSKSYFKNLGHLSLYHEFPAFKSMLTHGKNPVIVLNEAKKDSLLALELHDKKFVIISTQDEQGSSNWFYLVQQGIRFNYLFEGYYTSEMLTLKSFALNTKDNRNQQNKDQKKSTVMWCKALLTAQSPSSGFAQSSKCVLN